MAPDEGQVTSEPIARDRLTAECPAHGTVPVVCPRCAGKQGGRAHRGTTWESKKQRRDNRTRFFLRILPRYAGGTRFAVSS